MLWKLNQITLAPDVIFTIPGINLPVTNTLLCTWISILVLVAVFFAATRRRELVPRGIQGAVEAVVEYLRGLSENVAGRKYGRQFFPLAATLFVFILVSNLLDIFPGVDTIGTYSPDPGVHTSSQPILGFLLVGDISNQFVPWIRPATSDLNLTLAMAIVTVVTCQVYGFITLGAGEHLNKYFNIKSLVRKKNFEGVIDVFVGLLDIISEVGRIASLAFRLFGNVFAGSVVLAVFAFVLPFVADIIFIPFELLVAVIQALVFSLLTLIYLQLSVTSHEGHETEGEHENLEKLEHGQTAVAH